jgi:DNA (cytosine-5)-methyltransferase 1
MKPPYRVPTMAEIARIKWNGLTLIDLFSGCGALCLGFRFAGFKVLWANEFVPIAQESYRANMRKGTILDGRDVRSVKAEEILAAIGLKVGELSCLSGGPPCQAFSMSGQREKAWGKNRKSALGTEQKNEEMFAEFVRLRDGLRPRTFVAENVAGLVRGKAKGFFLEILRELKRGYRVEVRILDAQWLGVPQQRQRVIFVGVRADLKVGPAFPEPLPYRYSLREALAGVSGPVEPETDISRFAIGKEYDRLNPGQQSEKYFSLVRPALDEPCPTLTYGLVGGSPSGAGVVHPTEKRRFSIAEAKRLSSFPDDFELKGTFAERCERIGNSVPPIMARAIAEAIRDRVLLPARRSSGASRRPPPKARGRAGSRPPISGRPGQV